MHTETMTRRAPDPSMRTTSGTLNEHWYVAALADEVTTRRPTARTIMETPIVLWRDADGRATAVVDRCLHRNARLSGGDVFDGLIGCPYHGWTYDATGACVHVPSEGPDGCTLRRQLETFPVREQDGVVWVYLGTPRNAGGREPFRFPPVPRGWSSYVMVTRFDGDVTDLVENFMDVPHTAFVHRGWFRRGARPAPAAARVEVDADGVLVTYDRPDDAVGFSRRVLNADGAPLTHTDRFVMPNCTRVDYRWGARRQLVITSQITPVTPRTAVVYTAITFTFGRLTRLARLLLPAYTRVVINQDVRIMANQTANIARFGGRRFHGTDADVIHQAVEALRDHARDGDPGPPPAPSTTRITFWM